MLPLWLFRGAQEDRLNAEADRVQRTLTHTEKDLQLADEEQASIEEGILERTRDTQDEKRALQEQAQGLEAEIEELMRQVRALQARLAGVNEQLGAAEAKISVTRQSYERPLRRIAEKRDRIQRGMGPSDGLTRSL
jgi:chromosome segregation ATPase